MALLRRDLDERVYPGLDLVTVPLTQQQADALGAFTFNVGPGSKRRGVGFAGSKLLETLNRGEYDKVPRK